MNQMWTSVSVCWTWLSLCAVLCVSEDQKNITAEPGQTVTLPCEAPRNSSITAAEWTRPDLKPEYVLLYRSKQYDPDNQSPCFKNRVELPISQMKDGDVSLVLKNVKINDTGKYECHVIQKETSRRKRAVYDTEPISIIYLKVVEPGPTAGGGGHVGLTAGLLVGSGVIFAVAVFLLMRHMKKKNHDLVPPDEETSN